MGLDSGPVAPLMNPEEFAALRWDSSRNKEKDRGKEIPLVNVSAQGGGATPSTRLMSKAKKR